MRIQSLTRHAGVSFNGGPGLVHLRASNADSRVLCAAWERLVANVLIPPVVKAGLRTRICWPAVVADAIGASPSPWP